MLVSRTFPHGGLTTRIIEHLPAGMDIDHVWLSRRTMGGDNDGRWEFCGATGQFTCGIAIPADK